MEKITNYLELIQQIQDITPEKEAFCTTGKSLTYSQLYALAKEKQGMLKQEKKEFGEQNAKKQLRIIQTTCIYHKPSVFQLHINSRKRPSDPGLIVIHLCITDIGNIA